MSKLTCKYSKCNKTLEVDRRSIVNREKESYCCSQACYDKWQAEVAYFRGEEIHNLSLVEEMVEEGSLPAEALPKGKTKPKKGEEAGIEEFK